MLKTEGLGLLIGVGKLEHTRAIRVPYACHTRAICDHMPHGLSLHNNAFAEKQDFELRSIPILTLFYSL